MSGRSQPAPGMSRFPATARNYDDGLSLVRISNSGIRLINSRRARARGRTGGVVSLSFASSDNYTVLIGRKYARARAITNDIPYDPR